MIEDITAAVTGILTNVSSLLTPTFTGSTDPTATGYTYLLGIVGFAAVFVMTRRVLKKIHTKDLVS